MTDATICEQFYQPEEQDLTTRVALLVEYCGKNYHGSQYQPGLPTVQSTLQDGLRKLNLATSAVSCAGRTDAGVHALGQVAHFDVARQALDNIPDLPSALNAVMPSNVAVRAANLNAGQTFHSRRDALAKWYRYKIYNSLHRTAWASQMPVAHHRPELDENLMNQAAGLLLGGHDFTSFKDFGSAVKQDICHIYQAKVVRDGEFIILDVAADRFLYKMVRNIVGQLMLIGNANNPHSPEAILQVLAERDRRKAARSASPEGLTLMSVHYRPPFNLFEKDVYVQQFKNILKSMESLQNENLFRKAS